MAAHQAPPSLGSSRQEYWSGLPLPSPERMWKDAQISPPGCQDHEAHSSWRDLIWAQETPWTEGPGGLQSMGSQKSRTQISYYTTMIALILKAVSLGSVSPLKTSGSSRGCQRNNLNHEVCSRLQERVHIISKRKNTDRTRYMHIL